MSSVVPLSSRLQSCPASPMATVSFHQLLLTGARLQQPSPLLKWNAIRFKNGKYNFLTGKTGLMSVLTLKHSGGEVGDESRRPSSGAREQWPSPGKRSRGFWPTVRVNRTCPLCSCANKQDEISPPANLGVVARPVSAVEGECGMLVGTHGIV